jgi:hypothetical protein
VKRKRGAVYRGLGLRTLVLEKAGEVGGTWEHIWRKLLALLDGQEKLKWARAFLDGSFVPAKRGSLRWQDQAW